MIGIALLLAAAYRPGAGEAAQETPTAPAAVVSEDGAADQRELLRQILDELRGMRGDIRNLQRSLQAQRPQPPAPPPAPSSVPLGVGETIGNADAKVAIVEFSEFQCPFCKRFFDQTYGKLKETYIDSGKVRYESRDFPLAMHANARSASLAARCAGEQGAFWPMRAELFKEQSSLGQELYERLAKELKLDDDRFKKCLADPKEDQDLSAEIASAEALGVQGTPHFFLGRVEDGKMVSVRAISGAHPFESFRAALDELLGATGTPPSAAANQ